MCMHLIHSTCSIFGNNQGSIIDAGLSILPAVGVITYYAKSIFNQDRANKVGIAATIQNHNFTKQLYVISCLTTLVAFVAFNFFTFGISSALTTLVFSGLAYAWTATWQIYGMHKNTMELSSAAPQKSNIWW